MIAVSPTEARGLIKLIGISLYQAAALLMLAHLGRCTCKTLCYHLRPQCGLNRALQGRGTAPGVPVKLHPRLRPMETMGLVSSRPSGLSWGEWIWHIEAPGMQLVREARDERVGAASSKKTSQESKAEAQTKGGAIRCSSSP